MARKGIRHHLFRVCRETYRRSLWLLRSKVQSTVKVHAREGLFTVSTRDRGVGEPLYVNGQFEYEFSLAAVRLLEEQGLLPVADRSILDVGANIGVIGIGLVRAGLFARAVAVEPEPRNFLLLLENVAQNGLSSRIACVQMAAGDEYSNLTMELSGDNAGDHRIRVSEPLQVVDRYGESRRKTIEVPCRPLRAILELPEVQDTIAGAPSLLWIDVQGYEGYVFRGAGHVLSGGLPTVSELWPYGILRAGMALSDFCAIVASIWSDYWVMRGDRFIRYPVSVLDRHIDELGNDGHFGNIILTAREGGVR